MAKTCVSVLDVAVLTISCLHVFASEPIIVSDATENLVNPLYVEASDTTISIDEPVGYINPILLTTDDTAIVADEGKVSIVIPLEVASADMVKVRDGLISDALIPGGLGGQVVTKYIPIYRRRWLGLG